MQERLGARLRRRRKEVGLGLRESAEKLGISATYLSRIETDEERNPPAEKVLRSMADLLEDDFDTLMRLAGRVSAEVEAFIVKDPTMPQFLRAVRDRKISGDDLMKWLDEKKGRRR